MSHPSSRNAARINLNKLLVLLAILALTACFGGGDDDGGGGAVNSAPVITGGDAASESVDENETAVSTVVATDADVGDSLTFSLSSGADLAKFSITEDGVLSFVAAPNFEAPTDADTNNTYIVVVQVSDGTDTDTQTITVTVADVGEVAGIDGGGIKGPLVGAIVTAYELNTATADFKGPVAGIPGTTDAQARITGLGLPFPASPPYILEFTADGDTTDLVTGQAPVITEMRTVITQEMLNSGSQIYATPLTTMAVDLAIANADNATGVWAAIERDLDSDDDGIDDLTLSLGDDTKTTAEFLTALPIAATQVKSTMGFGIAANISLFDTPPLIDATTVTEAEQEDAAAYRAAVEAVTAVVFQINNATGTDDANAVLSALSADLADGLIDGEVDGATSDIYNNESETAGAALQLLEQDPSTLPIPNDPQGRTVGDMKQVVEDEKASLGYEAVVTTMTEEILELKPAETSSDIDGDEVPNDLDAFPEDATEQVDNDRDGLGDNADTDDDNDGVLDDDDAFPLDPIEQTDTDEDSIGDNADLDDDGDGVADTADDFPFDGTRSNKSDQDNDGWPSEQDANDNNATIPGTTFVDTDGDGIGNGTDADDDGDGVPDSEDAFPTDKDEQQDTDGDGLGDKDSDETDIDGDGVTNADDKFPRNPFETADTDRDGVGNNADNDDDGDGVDDAQEVQNGSDPLKRDTDGDGVLDNADQAPTDPEVQFDSDKDGVDNAVDNCPVHYNPTQANLDGDLRGDACDKDLDGDTVDNALDAFPYDAKESVDTDGDGTGNDTDDDDDGDGVVDTSDAFALNPNESVDTDDDKIGNKADTDDDNDGTPDASDAFPLDDTEQLDTDGDGTGNNDDTDDDGDGTADTEDAFPLDVAASTDTDHDGTANNTDTDDDGDGVADVDDKFPLNADEAVDTDADGRGNNGDTDDDGDGVADDNDAFPLLASEFKDTDGDGTGNNADTDDDGDGTADAQDVFPLNASESTDTDGDGVGNNTDTDDDNDGLSDTQEGVIGSQPLVRDTDGDTKGDGADNCPIVANPEQRDSDGDRLGDLCDTDDDGDTVLDGADNCPMTPNTSQTNADGDLLGDACDSDRDGDSVANAVDNCPTTPNADQLDADHNGIGDVCDADADGDKIVDVLDNCPAIANTDQANTDRDAQGNVCDADDDNDGLSDTEEASKGTDPNKPDSDGDGVNDRLDAFPLIATESKDSDGDGIGDNADNDQDADGVVDTADNCPLHGNADQLNTDGDAQGNACDNDDDNDGVSDNSDAFPLNPAESQDQDHDTIGDKADNCPTIANTDQLDTDNDKQGNACDADDDGDGVTDANDAFPLNGAETVDTDRDGVGNNADTDDDGDGVTDANDAFPLNGAETLDTDGDGVGNNADTDDDGDGVTDANDAFPLNRAETVDTDGDGTGNNADTDDDGDGVADTEDAFPLDDNETVDTDGDGVGNNADPDDDGDGLSDTEEEAKGTDPLVVDTDEDTVEDGADNCPLDKNVEQQDVDVDGVGDACDGEPTLSLYYLNERIVDAETETDSSGLALCPFDIGDEMTRVSLWLQKGADIKVGFGDEGLNKRGGHLANIDVSGRVTAFISNSHSDREGNSQELELTFDGQLNGANGVISGTVTETFTFKTAASEVVAICGYSSTETFTPMAQTAASTLFDGASGSNGGFVWMEANENSSGSSSQPSFEFFYGVIDNVGETEFRYDATAVSDPWLAVTEHRSSLILGASTWVPVADSLIVQGTPATTIDLVAKDASDTTLAHWQVTPFSASVFDKTMLGLVPRPWSEVGLTAPDAVFADTGVLGVGIHAVSQLDVYEVWCDNYSEGGYGKTLDCQNALIADWPEAANPPVLATSLSAVLHAPDAVPTETWEGINVGYAEGKELLAYLTGADTSGVEGSSGTVTFYERAWESGAISATTLPTGTWEITDPRNNDTNLVLLFNLPEGLGQAYQISGDSNVILLAVVNDSSDDLPYVRVGHFTPAGAHHYDSGLNVPAIEEVKGNFEYTPPAPDTDFDGVADAVDNCPTFPNSDQTDTDGNGKGDACEGASESDFDLDGVLDHVDNCPGVANSDQTDTDGNGVGDACEGMSESDRDGDGILDFEDNCPMTANSDQTDTDGNGKGDACEGTSESDFDLDGVLDHVDNCPGVANSDQTDTDGNGVGDACEGASESDFDLDGVLDHIDNCPGVANSDQTDTDGNGVGDACEGMTEPDSDGDGILDFEDNCPMTPNNDQTDTDGNGKGDACEGTSESDFDLDGVLDHVDNCPGVANSDQTDTDGNGVGDACEGMSGGDSDGDGVPNGEDRFPYDPSESADLDEDGVGDNADAFHDNAVEQFDTDGDLIGDNADLCPLVASAVAGVNHSDTDGDGIGNDCDPDQVGSVQNLEGFWLLTGDPADTNQVPDAAEENCVTDMEVGPFYTRAEIKQRGTQIWLHFEGDTMAGTIAPSGDFTLAAMHGSSTVIAGNYDGNAFTGFGWTESRTVTSGTCNASGTLALDPGIEVTEQTVIEGGGISWFEADFFWNDFLGVTEQQFFYGTLANADLELMFGYNLVTGIWDTVGGGSQHYLTATGTVAADDIFIVDGYVSTGESAIIKPTFEGTAVDHEISLVDLRELNVESLPLLTLLDKGYAAGILETDLFTTGARAYLGTITNTATAYSFDCDNDWEWFATQTMACNNIVAKDWVSNEPVPAASFDDVISSASELVEMAPSTAAKGLWVGEGDSFKILAFLQTDDGTVAGTYPVVHFLKEFSDMSKFKVGEGTFTMDAVGSTPVLILQVPESVRRLSRGDDDEGTPFLFVDTDTIDTVEQPVVRRGEIRVESSVEHEVLFNSVARDDIKGAFSPVGP